MSPSFGNRTLIGPSRGRIRALPSHGLLIEYPDTMSATPLVPAAPTPDPDRPLGKARSIGLTILLTIVTFGIWTFFWSFWTGEDLKRYRHDGIGGGVYLVLNLVIQPVVMFLMADEVAKLYQDAGEDPPINALWGLWFLLPVIGHIIWYVRIQNALNTFWTVRGAPYAKGV